MHERRGDATSYGFSRNFFFVDDDDRLYFSDWYSFSRRLARIRTTPGRFVDLLSKK